MPPPAHSPRPWLLWLYRQQPKVTAQELALDRSSQWDAGSRALTARASLHPSLYLRDWSASTASASQQSDCFQGSAWSPSTRQLVRLSNSERTLCRTLYFSGP